MTRIKLKGKEKLIKIMGDELGEIFYELHCEIFTLNEKWNEYKILFKDIKDNPKRKRLLKDSAPDFFIMIRDIMFEHFMLHISRITEPEKTGKNANLSIRRLLIDSIVDKKYESIKTQIQSLIDKAVKESEFTGIWRNKTLAHLDYDIALGRSSLPSEHEKSENIQNAIDSLNELINTIRVAYTGVEEIYKPFGSYGAQALINIIEDGLEYRRECN